MTAQGLISGGKQPDGSNREESTTRFMELHLTESESNLWVCGAMEAHFDGQVDRTHCLIELIEYIHNEHVPDSASKNEKDTA